jgi:hypothetical protein
LRLNSMSKVREKDLAISNKQKMKKIGTNKKP